ncbi:MAG TPA: DNA translocase FtsK 4TM domain-containing protein, partial [Jatrophihabitans sp.]|nr:DNA translocase FtsK 4TM domain-containing protein [Jatrophihabitans sp.]
MAPTGTKTRQPARKPPARGRGRTPARPPAKPANQRPPLAMVGRAIARLWLVLGQLAGTIARAVGRNAATARELDPAHRRDGMGLGVLGLAVVSAVSVWFTAAGALGHWLTTGFRFFLGNGAVLLPVLFLAGAVHILRQQPQPGRRGRLVVGGGALALTITGMLHLWARSPHSVGGWIHAGGVLGAASGQLERIMPAGLIVPLLFLLGCFGTLVVTATPISQLSELLRDLLSREPVEQDDQDVADQPSGRFRRSRSVIDQFDEAEAGAPFDVD